MFSRESELWVYMYNLLILMLETKFFFNLKKGLGTKSPQQCAGISLQSQQAFFFFFFWPRDGSAVGTERNLIHIG